MKRKKKNMNEEAVSEITILKMESKHELNVLCYTESFIDKVIESFENPIPITDGLWCDGVCYGFVKSLFKRDGFLIGTVEWTDLGKKTNNLSYSPLFCKNIMDGCFKLYALTNPPKKETIDER